MGVDKTYTSLLKQKYRLYFDNGILDSIISFIYKNSKLRTRKVLQNTLRLFNCMDMTVYEDKPDGYDRIWFIKKTLEAILKKEFANTEMIYQYCLNDAECDENKEAIIKHSKTISPITYEESKWLISEIEDRLNYGYTLAIKDKAQELFNQVDSMDFRSYKSISDQIYDLSVSVINAKRSASSLNSDQTFSLRDDVFEDSVTDSVNKLKDKNKMLITGIKRWNTILAPAYLSKRLYTYLALPGGGKSQILLKTALDIKKYNSHIKASDPNKNPAVLVITMENDIDETVERIFNMVGIEDDIRNYTPKQVIKLLKKEGALTLTEENNIDIVIKYYPNRSIDTNDLYTLISDMNDDGEEVIALILDYLKRIRPAEKGTNEKEELKNITNELKTLAKFYDIPVITAHQLNRNAASVVDAAIQAKKEDIAKLLSRDNVGSAWEIIENSDFVCILYQESKTDTGEMYMTFKLVKRRYRSNDESEKMRRLDYFSHPYAENNSIALIDDIDLPKSLSVFSLASHLPLPENEQKRGKKNLTDRPREKSYTTSDISIDKLVFENFSEDQEDYT